MWVRSKHAAVGAAVHGGTDAALQCKQGHVLAFAAPVREIPMPQLAQRMRRAKPSAIMLIA